MMLNSKTISIAAIILVVILFIIKIGLFGYTPPKEYHKRAFNSDYQIEIDSLNDKETEIKNNLNSIEFEKTKLITPSFSNYGYDFLAVGIKVYTAGGKKKTFLSLNDLDLKRDAEVSDSYLQYFLKDGQGYISTLKFLPKADYDQIVRVNKSVTYGLDENNILIPLKSSFVINLIYVYGALSSLLFLWLLLNALRNFIFFLIDVSKNKAFTESNCLRLKTISMIFLVFSITPLLLNLIIYILFVLKYGNDGLRILYSFWSFGYTYLILSVIFYIFFTAFKSGAKLKQENDLTI